MLSEKGGWEISLNEHEHTDTPFQIFRMYGLRLLLVHFANYAKVIVHLLIHDIRIYAVAAV